MAHDGPQRATLTIVPPALAEALPLTLALTPRGEAQAAAQREMAAALQNALDSRRQRIMISQSSVNWVKWTGLLLQAACTLLAVAMALFATGVAVSLVLIATHNRPFTGRSRGTGGAAASNAGRAHGGPQPDVIASTTGAPD